MSPGPLGCLLCLLIAGSKVILDGFCKAAVTSSCFLITQLYFCVKIPVSLSKPAPLQGVAKFKINQNTSRPTVLPSLVPLPKATSLEGLCCQLKPYAFSSPASSSPRTRCLLVTGARESGKGRVLGVPCANYVPTC